MTLPAGLNIETPFGLGALLAGPFAAKQEAVVLALLVKGDPGVKARARLNRKTGGVYTPQATRERQGLIAALAKTAMTELVLDAEGLFAVRAGFYIGNNQRRDIDNMLKLVCDALTGVIWQDDSQVVEMFGFKVLADRPEEARSEIAVLRVPGMMPYKFGFCRICQRRFRVYPSAPNRAYCSSRCLGFAQRRRTTHTCPRCQRVFETAQSGRKVFCSRACYSPKSVKTVTVEALSRDGIQHEGPTSATCPACMGSAPAEPPNG